MINLVHERTPMPEQSKDLRCKNFDEVALGYTPLEAVGEAMRCLNCREKPCVAGCPIHQQIPEFLARVAEGDVDGAYDVITQRSSLPAVCGRVCPQEQQCEKNCAHVRKGDAVAIGRLERFVADWHDAHTPISVPEVEKKGKKVAVIGSGPAGIACAGDLAALGYEVTVFEKLAYAGGILTYGIPTFVLPRSVVDRALKTLWAQGVEIVTGAPVDGARTVDDLFAAGYQAVFVGNGADVPQVPPGLDTTLAGVWTANDYLTQVNLHSGELPESIRAAKRVLVVGGGNVAVDAVRCARRLGAETIMVYRRTIAEAPARRDEIAHTYEEDIPIRELTNPVACYGENGVLTGVKCEKMALGEPDASGRRRPVGTGEFFDVPCDNLVIATGTSYSEEVVDTTTGIQKDRWGGIAAGEDGQTSRPGVFAGGDAVTGPKTVVQAMGAGKRAAVSIDKYRSERSTRNRRTLRGRDGHTPSRPRCCFEGESCYDDASGTPAGAGRPPLCRVGGDPALVLPAGGDGEGLCPGGGAPPGRPGRLGGLHLPGRGTPGGSGGLRPAGVPPGLPPPAPPERGVGPVHPEGLRTPGPAHHPLRHEKGPRRLPQGPPDPLGRPAAAGGRTAPHPGRALPPLPGRFLEPGSGGPVPHGGGLCPPGAGGGSGPAGGTGGGGLLLCPISDGD